MRQNLLQANEHETAPCVLHVRSRQRAWLTPSPTRFMASYTVKGDESRRQLDIQGVSAGKLYLINGVVKHGWKQRGEVLKQKSLCCGNDST